MLKNIFHIFFLLFCTTVQAQNSNYLFHHLGVKDGLSQGNVRNVCQDDRGFLWMLSGNAVQRYDGFHFTNFYPGRHPQFPAGIINGIELDKKNRLWISTGADALGYLDINKFTYHPVKVILPKEFNTGGATALQVNNDGLVNLVYPGRGMLTYNEAAGEIAVKYNPFIYPAGWEPRHLWQDEDLNYWSTSSSGVLKYNTKKKMLSYSGHNTELDPVIKTFDTIKNATFIYKDLCGRFWISSWQPGLQIKSYNPATGEIKSWGNIIGLSLRHVYYELYGIRQMKDGSLWANGPGLFTKLDYEKNTSTPVIPNAAGEYSIRYEQVNNLFEDRENSIWVCTNTGLYRFNPSAHIFHAINNRVPGDDKIYEDDVTGILETAEGELLVSTWGRGIFCYDSSLHPVASKYIQRSLPGEGIVWCMIQTSEGDIWRGGQDGFLYVYNAVTKKHTRLQPGPVNGRTIRQLAADKNGNVWLGTQGGRLIKWDKSDKQFHLQQQFRRFIAHLYVDNNNNLWACTDNDGVYTINTSNGKVLAHYTATGDAGKKLLINGASGVLQYNDSTLIIAGNGLNILNTRTGLMRYWGEGRQVFSMVKDNNNILWFSTDAGIASLNLDKKQIFFSYDARDGINNFDFSVAAGILLKDGRIVFGSSNDFVVFDPAKVLNFSFTVPEIQVSGISVMNSWLPVDSLLQLQQLTVSHDENAVVIRLTNNNYQNVIDPYYMLEGVDRDWKRAAANGEVPLNYLAPGTYTFKATNKDFNNSFGKVISIKIVVKPPFYKTWWFYSLMALMVTGLFFWIDRERQRRQSALQKMRSNIAGNLHKEVNKALSNINVLSEMAKLKADKDIVKSKEFIEQIHHKSQHMMIAMDDMLWSIDPVNDSMEKTVARMQEFIAAVNSRHGVNIVLSVDDQIKKLNLDMELRHELLLLFKYFSSSIAQAEIKDCIIRMSAAKNQLLFHFDCSDTECRLQLNNLMQSRETDERLKMLDAEWNRESTDNNKAQLTIRV